MKKNLLTMPALCLVTLASLFLPIAPAASASVSGWAAEDIPDRAEQTLGPAGIDIRDLAVASHWNTIYVAPGDSLSSNVTYKSTDAGLTWNSLSVNIRADLVAVAADDIDFVVVTCSTTPAVAVSTNGGVNWTSLGMPQAGGNAAAVIYDVAVSPVSNGGHYIAVAGKEAGDIANVWYFKSGVSAPGWQQTKAMSGFSGASMVKAVAFSPGFAADNIMIAVSSTLNVSIDLQILSLSSGRWNSAAGFTGYPVNIIVGNITDVVSASLAISPEYLGDDSTTRTIFAGFTINGDAAARNASGIYRIDDTVTRRLNTGVNIHSVAYNGTNLASGAYDSNIVYRSSDAMAATPAFSLARPMKRPGGEDKTLVSWLGRGVVAGTSGNESAFSVSGDIGMTFDDISLIDTTITNARDVAVSADGRQVYLVTDDGSDLSLWRRATDWERVLNIRGTSNYFIRLSRENSDVVYLARKGTRDIFYSEDGGKKDWSSRTCNINVQDITIESSQIVYALDATGEVSRSNNAGFSWVEPKPTGLDSGTGYTIQQAGANNLLVGSTNGYVAYSTDGNSSWTRIARILEAGANNVQIIADTGFATNRIIYAASSRQGQNIKKWAVGSSTDWTDIFTGTLSGGIYGLAIDGGILYALEHNTTTGQSALWICLSPTSATTNWSLRYTTTTTDSSDAQVHLNATPRALKVSDGGNLWAVKTNGTNKLYSITATLQTLQLGAPVAGATYTINPVTGTTEDIVFSWQRPSDATAYELNIALDPGFSGNVATITKTSSEATVTMMVGSHASGSARVTFTPGKTYYWRVRVTQPVLSMYSETRTLNTEPVRALVIDLLTPKNGSTGTTRTPSFSWAPVTNATEYRFVLADNFALISPIIDTAVKTSAYVVSDELSPGQTYYWSVKALAPAEGNWSALANFTVENASAGSTVAPPPVIISQAPAEEIHLPGPPAPPPQVVIVPPVQVPPPDPVAPAYLLAAIIIGSALIIVVSVLIVLSFRPIPPQPVPVSENKATKLPKAKSVILKAQAFRWMTTSENGGISLSAVEEQALGKDLASEIHALADGVVLYRESAEHAALLLYLWARYGSRAATSSYLTDSFRVAKENVAAFLNCYTSDSARREFGPAPEEGLSRVHYDAIADVVDPDSVVEALVRLYGAHLVNDDKSDTLLARQFVRLHQSVKADERERDNEVLHAKQ